MLNPPSKEGATLAELIRSHNDALTERTVEQACAQIPWYRTLSAGAIRRMFKQDYQALAQMLESNDTATLRAYVNQTGEQRIKLGAPAESLIAVATLIEENVRRLIDRELKADPALARDATRRVQIITKNIRMILSGINLRLIVDAHPPPPSALT
jgi:hypothetical protein